MKIYLAHNFKARWWLRDYAHHLELMGHKVTSRWLKQLYPETRTPEQEKQYACEDFQDIDAADAIILFTDQYGETPGKGKFMEYGYAYAKGKRIYIHGRDISSSIFYYLPNVTILNLMKDLEIVT